jgi:hypothetical protein
LAEEGRGLGSMKNRIYPVFIAFVMAAKAEVEGIRHG